MSTRSNGVTNAADSALQHGVRGRLGVLVDGEQPLGGRLLLVRVAAEHLREQLGAVAEVPGQRGEQVAEPGVVRAQAEGHGRPLDGTGCAPDVTAAGGGAADRPRSRSPRRPSASPRGTAGAGRPRPG